MEQRQLGRCGLSVSVIGYGAFKLGRNEGIKYAEGYALPSEAEAVRLLHAVLDLGVTLVDTAPAYGLSEARVGAALQGRRDRVVLTTKVGETFGPEGSRYDFTRAAIERSLSESLRTLRTDRLDIVFIHAHARDLDILTTSDAVETLLDARQRGWTRAIGLSVKTLEAGRAALAWADVLMVEYSPQEQSLLPLLEEAAAAGVGVVIKKGLGSGRLNPADAIPFVLAAPGVGSLLISGLNLDHFRENVRIAENHVLKSAAAEGTTRMHGKADAT